jgi:NAD(P)-dependent dehydrogenase (short-subunit alcohol dehydrogenase family)
MDWKGKVAVITGASSGIGRETAVAVAERGATVVLGARREERLKELAQQIASTGGSALPVVCDISIEEDVRRLFKRTVETFGRVDWLINNAGTGLYATVEETTPEQMERIWRVNFLGTFYCIRVAIPLMKKQASGHIITVASMAGVRGTAMKSAYCASKFAQIGLMDSLRRELQGVIHCTTILPGATESEFISSMENPGGRRIPYSGPVRKPSAVATAIVRAIEHPSARKITQQFGIALATLNALSPNLTDWIVQKLKKASTD